MLFSLAKSLEDFFDKLKRGADSKSAPLFCHETGIVSGVSNSVT